MLVGIIPPDFGTDPRRERPGDLGFVDVGAAPPKPQCGPNQRATWVAASRKWVCAYVDGAEPPQAATQQVRQQQPSKTLPVQVAIKPGVKVGETPLITPCKCPPAKAETKAEGLPWWMVLLAGLAGAGAGAGLARAAAKNATRGGRRR